MLAARRKFDRDDIAAFLDAAPGEARRNSAPPCDRAAPRKLPRRSFFQLCRDHDVAIVFGDDDEFPCIDADTASFAYARLQRMREDVPTGYDDKSLDDFARRARKWRKDGRDSYIFMINGAKVRAPAAALALQERLDI